MFLVKLIKLLGVLYITVTGYYNSIVTKLCLPFQSVLTVMYVFHEKLVVQCFMYVYVKCNAIQMLINYIREMSTFNTISVINEIAIIQFQYVLKLPTKYH